MIRSRVYGEQLAELIDWEAILEGTDEVFVSVATERSSRNTLNGEDHHFYASGKNEQYIYVDPEGDLVIVRLGNEEGEQGYWINLFNDLATKLATSTKGPR